MPQTMPVNDGEALYDAMSWMSPAWPIGAFAYSTGLEWAVEAGHVRDRTSCLDWISDLIRHGPFQGDAVFFVHSWRAARAGDQARLEEVAELAHAAQTSRERRLEATAQGAAFLQIAQSTAPPGPQLVALLSPIRKDELTYPIAAAALFALSGAGLETSLTAFLHGMASNLVSAAQRLVPIGQTDGQRVLADLRNTIIDQAKAAADLPDGDPFDQLASAAFMAEIACMKHETQYTRLFRT